MDENSTPKKSKFSGTFVLKTPKKKKHQKTFTSRQMVENIPKKETSKSLENRQVMSILKEEIEYRKMVENIPIMGIGENKEENLPFIPDFICPKCNLEFKNIAQVILHKKGLFFFTLIRFFFIFITLQSQLWSVLSGAN